MSAPPPPGPPPPGGWAPPGEYAPPGPPPRRGKSPLLWIGLAVGAGILVIILLAALLIVVGQNRSQQASGPGEIFLQPIADAGPDPFGPSVAGATPNVTIPPNVPVTITPPGGGTPLTAPTFPAATGAGITPTGPLAVSSRSGGTPGLFGGTRDQSSCDKQKMIDFLAANPDKATAWAQVQGIATGELSGYIDGLTAVLLRSDTRVTNHGFKNGAPRRLGAILQAGTAVLVDNRGVPRARCACGNPLLPPRPAPSTPTYQGRPWPGFTPTNITVINNSTTVINIITVIDVRTGEPFGRPTGPRGGPDQSVPGRPGTTTSGRPTSTTFASTTSTTAAGAGGPFTLVNAEEKVTELRNSWHVQARAGTAQVIFDPNQRGDYAWTVPQQIDPAGTKIQWGGTSKGNVNIDIEPFGEGVTFDQGHPERAASGRPSVSKSGLVTVTTDVREVKLWYAMGYSVTVTYTYRR